MATNSVQIVLHNFINWYTNNRCKGDTSRYYATYVHNIIIIVLLPRPFQHVMPTIDEIPPKPHYAHSNPTLPRTQCNAKSYNCWGGCSRIMGEEAGDPPSRADYLVASCIILLCLAKQPALAPSLDLTTKWPDLEF